MSSSTASRFSAVSKNDSATLPGGECRALFVGTGGDLVVTDSIAAVDVTFKNVSSGTVLPIRTNKVKSTGTTATDIVALY